MRNILWTETVLWGLLLALLTYGIPFSLFRKSRHRELVLVFGGVTWFLLTSLIAGSGIRFAGLPGILYVLWPYPWLLAVAGLVIYITRFFRNKIKTKSGSR